MTQNELLLLVLGGTLLYVILKAFNQAFTRIESEKVEPEPNTKGEYPVEPKEYLEMPLFIGEEVELSPESDLEVEIRTK